ncbi:MAG: AI-2E family transporter [Deltaproteobacteria bacterium]|nr:AI-2E family transporter [Deltaproteobacteria bacterium]
MADAFSPKAILGARAVRVAVVVAIAVGIVYWLRDAFVPIGIAWVLAYHLSPFVRTLETRRFTRSGAAAFALAVSLVVVLVFLIIAVPIVARELADFAKRLPRMVDVIRTEVIPWLERSFEFDFPTSLDEALARLPVEVKSQAPQVAEWLTRGVTKLLSGTFTALIDLLALLIIPVLMFFFLRDQASLARRIEALIPLNHRETVMRGLRDVDSICATYLRGKIRVSLVLAILYSVGLALSGVPMAITLGIFAGLINIIPYLGAVIGVVVSLIFSFLDFHGWGVPAGVVVTFVVGQALDVLVLSPLIVGKSLGLSTLAFLVALLVGSAALGVVGLILSVPSAALLQVWGRAMVARYRESALYTGSG